VVVAVVVDGRTTMVEIPAGQARAELAVDASASVAYTVPGWGVGAGSVAVGSNGPAPPAAPVPGAPAFTG
jgi:hypothetical protein